MAINTDKAAKPVGKYVHAKEAGDLVFLRRIPNLKYNEVEKKKGD